MKTMLQVSGLMYLLSAVGCGSGINDALLFAGESGTRTFLDVLISDFYSNLPDVVSFPPGPGEPAGGGATQGDGTGTETGAAGAGSGGAPPASGGGGSGADLTGDADNGAALFTGNSCTACHCDDASGGCLPTAPNIQGQDFATVEERLQGETEHPGGKFPDLTEQDIADLVAFLAEQAG